MAVDKVKWHVGGEFPAGLPHRNGATHIGMFVDWAMRRGLMDSRLKRWPIGGRLLRHGIISGRTFILWFCDQVLSSIECFDEQGHRFADFYYDRYFSNCASLFDGEYGSAYRVPYSRRNRQRVAEMLDHSFANWQR